MAVPMAHGGVATLAVRDVCSQLYARNLAECAAYQELVNGYQQYLSQATQSRKDTQRLEQEVGSLREENAELKNLLKDNEKNAVRNAEAKALEEQLARAREELGAAYKTNAGTAQQLLQASNAVQSLKADVEEKARRIQALEEELAATKARLALVESQAANKDAAVELAAAEAQRAREERREMEARLKKVEAENKDLVDRWMEQKLKDAERLNELNDMYEDLLKRSNAQRLEDVARTQVDGIVRQSEGDAADFVPSGPPSSSRHTLRAHEGGCSALAFDHGAGSLFTGGTDKLIKVWETAGGTVTNTLRGALGQILDLSVSANNGWVLGCSSDNKLYLWDVSSGRIRHTMTGHVDKVIAVDFSGSSGRKAVSAAHDRTLKIWDLNTGYGIQTIICHSNCNTCCVVVENGVVASGHMDGHIRFWDMRSGRLANEVAAHAQGVTSVCLSRDGATILSNGRDNVLNLIDVRTFEARTSLRAAGYRVATNWSRACLSPDARYAASGSVDGTVFVWNTQSGSVDRALKGHTGSVLSCSWSDRGRPLASADKNGNVVTWE